MPEARYLRVKNWDRFQHYKNREHPPPWIKLYESLLTDYDFQTLTEQQRWQLIGIWLLASKTGNKIPKDNAYVGRCISSKRLDLDLFVSRGFLETVYTESRDALDQKRREENRGEKKRERASKAVPVASNDTASLAEIIDISLKEGAA